MINRRIMFFVFFVCVIFVCAKPVIAQTEIPKCDIPPCVYVDRTNNDGNEDGSEVYPYNTENEGKALAQSQPRGAWLYVKDINGNWRKEFIPRATPGAYGDPFPAITRYIVLAMLALLLILLGWWLIKRSQKVRN